MTTLEGSVESGSPEAGNGGAGEGSTVTSSNDYLSGLDEGSREWITNNGIKTDNPAELLSGVVTKSREMESLIGKSLRLPGEDATPEDLNKFYDKATERLRPQEASGYEFTVPEEMPEDLPYNSEFADEWRQFSFDAKLPKNVSSEVHDWFVTKSIEQVQAQQEAHIADLTNRATESSKVISEDWGQEGTEGYNAKQEFFFKAAEGLGILDSLKSNGILDEHNQVLDGKMVVALSKVGEAMFAEDTLVGGDNRLVGGNPFADDTKNYTKQSELIKSDPELAQRLIKQAGKDPARYGRPDWK